jgi:DNA mismatch repair protein MutL
MQHKYPFTVLHFVMDGNDLDVNVHPTKMELRFSRQQEVYNFVYEAIRQTLTEPELIPRVSVPKATDPTPIPVQKEEKKEEKNLDYFMKKMQERVTTYHEKEKQPATIVKEEISYTAEVKHVPDIHMVKETRKEEQLNLFDEKLLAKESIIEHKIIGQVFDTYWLVEFQDEMYIIDQHAAHERILYERTLQGMKNRDYTSQYLSPPIILTLSMQEETVLKEQMETFANIGFEIEAFGESSYAVRAVPDNLFGIAKKDLLIEMLDNLVDGIHSMNAPDLIAEKVASMSCKAAVKGNSRLSRLEVEELIRELLKLENPYHCPHGRPTIIAMTKRDLEKKFK